jgi:predicted kinase
MHSDTLVAELDAGLPEVAPAESGGSLLMLVGLPGVGKTSIVLALQRLLPCVLIATDHVRARIRQLPTYTTAERRLVYEVCYALTERRLRRGQRVVFDGSNNQAERREYLANLAQRNGVPMAVCVVQAAQEVIQARLIARQHRGHCEKDKSDADWLVYKWMVETQEPVVGEHLILDTTMTAPDVLAQKLYTYWLYIEQTAASDPDLQPPSWASKLSLLNGVGS